MNSILPNSGGWPIVLVADDTFVFALRRLIEAAGYGRTYVRSHELRSDARTRCLLEKTRATAVLFQPFDDKVLSEAISRAIAESLDQNLIRIPSVPA